MAGTFRIIALIFVVSPFAAMFSEPFFEAVFDLFGWDTESWAAPVASAIMTATAFIGSPALVSYTTYLAILGVGVWLHYFAVKRDNSKPDYRSVGADGYFLSRQVRDALERFSLTQSEGERLLMACYAHFVNMRKVGLDAPSPPKDYNAKQFLEVSAQFMAAYYEVSSRSTKRESIRAAKILTSKYQSRIS